MIQFNLNEYLKNPQRELVTRMGYPARVICTDREGVHERVVYLVKRGSSESLLTCGSDGKPYKADNDNDLFFKPQEQSGFIYLYKKDGNTVSSKIFVDGMDCKRAMRKNNGFGFQEIFWKE